MSKLEYFHEKSGSEQQVKGKDGRLNTDSRSEPRAFYVSRDNSQAYVLVIEDDDAVAGDIIAYLKNDSKDKKLYVQSIVVSCANAITIKVAFGDSTVATGSPVTPANLNRPEINAADVTSFGNGAIGGVIASTFLPSTRCPAGDSKIIFFNDALILGPNSNIIVEYDAGTTGAVELSIYFFFE